MERFIVQTESDIGISVVGCQNYALKQGLAAEKVSRLGTAVSELARNIYKYCPQSGGDIVISYQQDDTGRGQFSVEARDNGPGIANLDEALQDHFSTSGTLGLGLPGVRRICDHFEIRSELGRGTVVSFVIAC